MLSFICAITSTSITNTMIYNGQNQVHTLRMSKILGNHLTSFTSHYVGDIDKHQCRFTD